MIQLSLLNRAALDLGVEISTSTSDVRPLRHAWSMRAFKAFAAIDFETANQCPESACAVGIVRVENGRITARESRLLRPPENHFSFSDIHGITWGCVAEAPTFAEAWPALASLLSGIEFIAAHNACFDRSVLAACCDAARLLMPPAPFLCTVRLARQTWGIFPTALPAVCRRLRIPLRHHDALSDAEASARIVMMAGDSAFRPFLTLK